MMVVEEEEEEASGRVTDCHVMFPVEQHPENVTVAGGRSPGVMIGLGEFWFQSFAVGLV
jgi:hypothetical protein